MTNVVMPQMGESIAEGTIVRWIKKVGDAIDRDEPLFEISTDKVDAEIPSPAAGVLTEIKVKEGETVAVNSVVATIGAARRGGVGATPAADRVAGSCGRSAGVTPPRPRQPACARRRRGRGPTTRSAADREDSRRQKSSPLVRKIAQEHKVDITQIQRHRPQRPRDEAGHPRLHRVGEDRPPATTATRVPASAPAPGPSYKPGENVQVVPMSVMRKKIAEHMVLSAHTSPHVLLGVRSELRAGDGAARQEEGRVRGGRREAHLHRLHRQGGD